LISGPCLLLLLLQQGDAIRQELRIEFGLAPAFRRDAHKKCGKPQGFMGVFWGLHGILIGFNGFNDYGTKI